MGLIVGVGCSVRAIVRVTSAYGSHATSVFISSFSLAYIEPQLLKSV